MNLEARDRVIKGCRLKKNAPTPLLRQAQKVPISRSSKGRVRGTWVIISELEVSLFPAAMFVSYCFGTKAGFAFSLLF